MGIGFVLESSLVKDVEKFYVCYGVEGNICCIGKVVCKVGYICIGRVVNMDVFIWIVIEVFIILDIVIFWANWYVYGDFCSIGEGIGIVII